MVGTLLSRHLQVHAFSNFFSQSCDSDLSILSLGSQSMVILTQVQITDLGKGKILLVLNQDSAMLSIYVNTDKLRLSNYHLGSASDHLMEFGHSKEVNHRSA